MPNYNTTLQTNNSSLEEIITKLNNLPNAGGIVNPVLQNKIVTPTTSKQTVNADSGYDGLNTVTVNAIPTTTQATPVVTINVETGLVTAKVSQAAGYVESGTKSGTLQLAFREGQIITPGTDSQIIPANTYIGGNQIITGDRNLIPANIVSGKSIFGVIGVGDSDADLEDGLVTRSLTSYINDRVTSIGYAAFYLAGLEYVAFPKCKNIDGYAFYRNPFSSISFPACEYIQGGAFRECWKLQQVSFPVCLSIGTGAFADCTALEEADFPKCTVIDYSAFSGCSWLATASFPMCTKIGHDAFGNCTRLQNISFPACVSIGYLAFINCTSLTTANFPMCSSIGYSAFSGCAKLSTASFPMCTYIGAYAFSNTILSTIYLTGSSLCSLYNSNAFSNTRIGSYQGSIFVPSSLVNTYKRADQWSYFSNRIFAYTSN